MQRDYNQQIEELSRWKEDNIFLIDKHDGLQQKMQLLKRDLDKQKQFYEMALEQRFKQMEEFEEECMHLRQRVQELETRENDNKIKSDMAIKDKEELKKKLDIKINDNSKGIKREEEL